MFFLKIAICCPYISRGKGGLERVGIDLANAMSNRHHDVALVYFDECAPRYSVNEEVLLINDLANFDLTVSRLEKFSPDVFLAMSSGHLVIYMAKIAFKLACPLGIHESSMFGRYCGENWARPRNLDFFDAVVEREVICSYASGIRHVLGHSLHHFPDYIRSKVDVFPNPVNVHASAPADRANRKKVILNIGGLKKVKNIFPILYSFRELADKFPDWKLLIAGRGFDRENNYQTEILEYIQHNGLKEKVLLLGEVEDISKLYMTSSFHVTASQVENFGMAVAESMCFGLPSVGFTNSYGTSELIEDGVNGLLVQEKSPSSLTDAFLQLMGDADLRDQLSLGCVYMSAMFDPEITYDKWELFFSKISHSTVNSLESYFESVSIVDHELALYNCRKLLEMFDSV